MDSNHRDPEGVMDLQSTRFDRSRNRPRPTKNKNPGQISLPGSRIPNTNLCRLIQVHPDHCPAIKRARVNASRFLGLHDFNCEGQGSHFQILQI